MTDPDVVEPVAAEDVNTPAARLASYIRGGGIGVPLLTALIAFLIAGLVVLVTGHNPLTTYKAIFNGTGLNWLFPWTSGADRTSAALNLQQTLIATTPLILVGLAVAFAFRAGLFNIGGQGQYIVGSIVAVYFGSKFGGMPHVLHVVLVLVLACVGGAIWAGIAGLLKATTGANEVISTIMLNWIAIWTGVWLFGLGGPLQNPDTPSVPISSDVTSSAKLPVFWGNPQLQGVHVGLFISLAVVVVFWFILNRSITGYEVRAVGFNPEAARYSGMSVARNYVKVMAICGVFAGLAGGLDILGWQFRIATNDVLTSDIGFLGIAVALLGRNTASGTVAAALLFGALKSGTSQRNLDPSVFDPSLATNLTLIIQGLIVLLVSTDVLALRLLRGVRRLRGGGGAPPAAPEEART
jgi:simple sugar transport system permease protein